MITKNDIFSGNNLLSSREPSFDELFNVATAVKDAVSVSYTAASRLLPIGEVVSDSWDEQFVIDGEDTPFSISSFALHKLLNNMKFPPSFYDRIPAHMKKWNLEEITKSQKGYLSVTHVTDDNNQHKIIGVRNSKSNPWQNTDIVEFLFRWVQDNGFNARIEHAVFDVNHMSFKVILVDDIKDIGNNDTYQFGIAIQNSVVKYCDTVISPMLYRTVCKNGLTVVKNEKTLVDQSSLALPKEALKVVFKDCLEWFNSDQASKILASLASLRDSQTKWNVKRVKALLPQVLAKVPADYANPFKTSIFEVLPENNDKFAAGAYDVINMFTNKAQNYPAAIQTQIESNVLSILANALSDKAVAV